MLNAIKHDQQLSTSAIETAAEQSNTDSADALSAYQNFLTYRINQLSARLNAQAARLLRDNCDLGLIQWRILFLVNACGPVHSAKLVKAIAMDAGLFSRNLKSMIADGLIHSQLHKDDHRQQLLTLTKKGKAAYERAAPFMRRRRENLTKGLSISEQECLLRLMNRIDINLLAIPDE